MKINNIVTCFCVKSLARCFVLFNFSIFPVKHFSLHFSTRFPMLAQTKTSFFEIQTQFLCCVPIKQFQWKDTLSNLSWDEQNQLLNETVRLERVQKYPLDRGYMIRFMRYVIDTLESQNLEVHDDFYTILCDYQSKSDDAGDSEYSYKHYQVLIDASANGRRIETVILKENRNKISHGTTGLNVWESALAISEWAIENRCQIDGKNILELGAGTGLSSLIIGKCCAPKTIHITDGNDRVIENLIANVANNFEKMNDDQRNYHADNETTVDVVKLDWTQKDTKFVRDYFKEVDLIIAADVIYDSSLFDALLSTIRMLFDCCDNCNKFMLVNAVRNPETEREFLRKLDAYGLQYCEERSIHPKLLYWQPNEFSPIKLYSIFNQSPR